MQIDPFWSIGNSFECPSRRVEGYHLNYNIVIIKLALPKLAKQNPHEKFILPMITIL